MSKKQKVIDPNREKYWQTNKENNLSYLSEDLIEARRSYFLEGGALNLLESNAPVALGIIINDSPAKKLDDLIQDITEYCFWFHNDPSKKNYWHRTPNITEEFNSFLLSILNGALDEGVAVELFHWLYGETYTPKRQIVLEKDGATLEIDIDIDATETAYDFLCQIPEYFWWGERGGALAALRLKEYFFSVYPKMSEVCFRIDIPDDEEFQDESGITYRRAWVKFNHWFIALLNGYITDYETFKEINEWHCYDLEAFTEFKKELSELKMPDAYYLLEKEITSYPKDHIFELAW
jgi:hypothetical protein